MVLGYTWAEYRRKREDLEMQVSPYLEYLDLPKWIPLLLNLVPAKSPRLPHPSAVPSLALEASRDPRYLPWYLLQVQHSEETASYLTFHLYHQYSVP